MIRMYSSPPSSRWVCTTNSGTTSAAIPTVFQRASPSSVCSGTPTGGWPRLNSEKRLGAVSLRFSSGAEDTAGGAGGLRREEQEGGAAERADGVGGGRNSGEFFLEG